LSQYSDRRAGEKKVIVQRSKENVHNNECPIKRNTITKSRRRQRQQQQQEQQQQQQQSNTVGRKKIPYQIVKFNKHLSTILDQNITFAAVEHAEQLLLRRVNNTQQLQQQQQYHNSTTTTTTTITSYDYDTLSFNLVLKSWARQRSSKAARRADSLLQILLSLDRRHVQADAYSYSAVLNAYAKSNGGKPAAQRAEQLLHQMEVSMKVTSDICYNSIMEAWALSGEEDAGRRAQFWLTKLEDNQQKLTLPQPTRISYNICLKAWARSKHGEFEAHRLLDRMNIKLPKKLRPDKISYSTCIDAYCRSTTNLTLAAEKSEELLCQMEEASTKNLTPDVVAYSSVLSIYARAGVDDQRALGLIGRMKRYAGEEPNTSFLNTMIHLYAKQGKAHHAEALLETMKQRHMADKISYTSAITAHANTGNATRAMTLFNELYDLYKLSKSDKSDRFLPTEKTFAALIHSMAKSKDSVKYTVEHIDNLIQTMQALYNITRRPELLPSTVTYSTIFYLLSRMKDPKAPVRALELLDEMKRQQINGTVTNVRLDATVYAYLINIITKSRIDRSAKMATMLLDEVERGYASGNDNLRPTQLLYSAVLQSYAKSASKEGADLAEVLLKRTKDLYKQGKMYAKPNTLFYNAVIDSWARAGQGRSAALRAEELLNELESKCQAGDLELSPTARSYNAAILAWKTSNATEAPQRAEALLKRMNERYSAGDEGCRPDQVTINSIISVWANSGFPEAAERAEEYLRFMEEMYYNAEDESLRPDSISYNCVIDAYAKSGLPDATERAEDVFDRMHKNFIKRGDEDLRPNIITLTCLTNAWSRRGEEFVDKAESKRKLIRYLISEEEGGGHAVKSDNNKKSILRLYPTRP
jgi:pentatricopeptide repeat protein